MVAAFFALAEITRAVGGDDVRIHDLTPPGVEPHDLELNSKQIDRIEDADVVVVIPGLMPAVDDAVKRAKGKVVRIDPTGPNLHLWLSPNHVRSAAADIAQAIPGASEEAFDADLIALDAEFIEGTRNCQRRALITGHDAFSAWSVYDLELHPIAPEPEAEPDPRRLAELADLIRRTGTTTVFSERLAPSEAAETLARETGTKVDVLDTLESGEPGTYLEVMRSNLAKVKAGLGCT